MPATLQELQQQLLALNSPDVPYVISQEGNKVIAKWNFVDAKWLQMFAEAGLKEAYEIELQFDETKHEVSYTDKLGSVSWTAGVPRISFQANYFKGKTYQMSKGFSYGVKTDGTVGTQYKYDFSTETIKKPLFEAIEKAGWKVDKSLMSSPVKSGSAKTVLAVVAVIIVLALIAAFKFVFSALGQMSAVAQQEAAALNAGDIPKAYSYTSASFQKGTSEPEFENFVNQYPLLKKSQSFSFSSENMTGSTGNLIGQLHFVGDGEVPSQVSVVQENGTWKISSMSFNWDQLTGVSNPSPSPVASSEPMSSPEPITPAESPTPELTSPEPSTTPSQPAPENSQSQGTSTLTSLNISSKPAYGTDGTIPNSAVETTYSPTDRIYGSVIINTPADQPHPTLSLSLIEQDAGQVVPITSRQLTKSGTVYEQFDFHSNSPSGFPAGSYILMAKLSTGEDTVTSFTVTQ